MSLRSLVFVAGLAVAASISGLAAAEEIRLSDLTDEDMVALQRGHDVATGACAAAIINEIDAYGGPEAMREFVVDVEAYPVVIESVEAGLRHECEAGVHTWVENGTRTVVQRYDEAGQPTMMEQ